MKLVLAVIQADDLQAVTQALNAAGYRVTRIATQGGWLRRENATLLIGVEDAQVDDVLNILRRTAQRRTAWVNIASEAAGMFAAQPIEVEIGGATVFVLNVERFVQLSSDD